MSSNIDLVQHEKRHTDFHQKRAERAKAQAYDAPVTAFLSDVFITSCAALWISFDHKNKMPRVASQMASGSNLRYTERQKTGSILGSDNNEQHLFGDLV